MLVFACIGTVLGLWRLYLRFRGTVWVRTAYFAAGVAITAVYFAHIGFEPPYRSMHFVQPFATWTNPAACVAVCALLLIVCLVYIRRYFGAVATYVTVAAMLLPVCFVSVPPFFQAIDAAYILTPALKLLHGASVNDIYLQYDLLYSLLAGAWLAGGFDPQYFYLVVQCSFYVFLLLFFVVARRLLLAPALAFPLLAALLLVRMYCYVVDPLLLIQVAPLRLDWWLAFLALVLWKGPYHFSVGVLGAAMLVLNRNFGMIYALAYVELLLILAAIDGFGPRTDRASFWVASLQAARDHLRRSARNLCLLAFGAITAWLMFRGENFAAVYLYQRIGLGFLRITATSFYWYALMLITAVPVVVLGVRGQLPRRYVETVLFLDMLAIGNSIYFFGRSHESNLINISGPLLGLLFILLDIVAQQRRVAWRGQHAIDGKKVAHVAAAACIVAIATAYGGKIVTRASAQANLLRRHEVLLPTARTAPAAAARDLVAITRVTGGERKLYFMTGDGFQYYFYGGYEPVGYFQPYETWIYRADMTRFVQGLIDSGYCIVLDATFDYQAELPGLTFRGNRVSDRFRILSK